jgi:tetratricopeptide (TPR) repeat protein
MYSLKNYILNALLRNSLPILALALCLGCQSGYGQSVPPNYQNLVDSIIRVAPKHFVGLAEPLKPFEGDTLAMRYLNALALKRDYPEGRAFALNQLGIKYRDISQYGKALKLHQEALKIASDIDNIEFRVLSMNFISLVYRKIDAIKSALDYSQEALELAESQPNPSQGLKRSINLSLNSIGNIYKTLEQYDLAIAKFNQSKQLEEEIGLSIGIAENLQNIGECYEAQGKLEAALTNYEAALDYNKKVGSSRVHLISNLGIAHIYVHMGKQEEALERLLELLPLSHALGDQQIIAMIHNNLGWTYTISKRYTEADAQLQLGLDIAQRYKLPSEIVEANTRLHDLNERMGDYKKSLQYYKRAQQVRKEFSNDRNRNYVADMLSGYESEKRGNELEVLARQNEMANLKLRKNRTSMLVAGIFLLLLTGIFYILYRQKQLKSEKKMLTLEQSMLRSQMNPHFLFNSLNSIKLYIINNDKKNAVHYLNKFSKLVRKILEASSQKEITLAEELETVELYMNIEDIRFSYEIDFKVKVDADIDIHQVKIPSLILQPFLENALWHGLSSKEGVKKIDLRASKEGEGFIKISITDNGVGREAAEIIKEGRVLKRKSVGIDITKERLANFSKDFQNSFKVEIEDLHDKDGNASGTRINLRIPTI